AWDRGSGVLLRCTRDGVENQLRAHGVEFAPGRDAVSCRSVDGTITTCDPAGHEAPAIRLPEDARPTGAIVVCANESGVSVPAGVLVVSRCAREVKSRLAAPEGPVPHLICDGSGRLFGGSRGVFTLDPAADARVRPVTVPLASPVRGLAAAGIRLWVLES